MIIVLKPEAGAAAVRTLVDLASARGLRPLHQPGSGRIVLGARADARALAELQLEAHPLVASIQPLASLSRLVSRDVQPHDTIVEIGGVPVGGETFTVVAGPCAVESREQMLATAEAVRALGGHALRGGAFKPRSSPYSFQGLGLEGLEILAETSRAVGLPTVTEVVEVQDVTDVETYADCFQVGARNMQNFRLLQALGRSTKPVILKRGMAASIEDLLLAAEYVVSEGNSQVILCERGIRTFETATRNTLDLSCVPLLKQRCHLPVMVDPSHGTGVRELIAPMSRAALACGADGILVEVHVDPDQALSDGPQSLDPEGFARLMDGLRPFADAAGRRL